MTEPEFNSGFHSRSHSVASFPQVGIEQEAQATFTGRKHNPNSKKTSKKTSKDQTQIRKFSRWAISNLKNQQSDIYNQEYVTDATIWIKQRDSTRVHNPPLQGPTIKKSPIRSSAPLLALAVPNLLRRLQVG